METVRISAARANLKLHMDIVCETREPLVITRPSGDPVVMMSLNEYNSLKETCELLSVPANAQRLAQSLEQLNNGEVKTVELFIDQGQAATH